MPTDPKELKDRAGAAFTRREAMKSLYRLAYRLGMPEREGFDFVSPGERKHRAIYDSTFQDSVERLANLLLVGMVPPWLDWFELVPGPVVPDQAKEPLSDALEAVKDKLSLAIALSNFYTASHSTMLDLAFGTGALLIEEDDETDVCYTAVPPYQLGLEEGARGKIAAVFREHRVGNRHVEKEFPGAKIPLALRQRIEKDPNGETKFVSCVVDYGRYSRQTVFHDDTTEVILEKDFQEFPYAVPRWYVLSGETFGRGPALKAASTAYTLNECMKLSLKAANVALLGMWKAEQDGVLNPATTKLVPGGITAVGDIGNLQPLVPGVDFNLAQFQLEDLRSMIKRDLMVDQLGNVEGPKMTATEILERQAIIAQDKGAAFGRLTSEFLGATIERTAGILRRKGRLPPVAMDGRVVAYRFVSPLARAQGMSEVDAIRATVADALSMADLDPGARAIPRTVDIVRAIAQKRGVPLRLFRTEAEVGQVMQQFAQAQASLMMAGQEAPAA